MAAAWALCETHYAFMSKRQYMLYTYMTFISLPNALFNIKIET